MKKSFIYIFLIAGLHSYAQKVKDTVKTEVVEVVKSFNPQVQDAFKLSVNPDSIQVIEKKIPVDISIQSVPVASTFQPEKGSMSNFQFQGKYQSFPASYALMGIGNYTHFWTQAFLDYKVTDRLQTGLYFNHFSTQGKDSDSLLNPAYNTKANLLFNYKNLKSKWFIDLGYQSKITYLNPSPFILSGPDDDYVSYSKQRNNNFFHLTLDGKIKESLLTDLHFDFVNFWDPESNNENKIIFTSDFIIPIGGFNIKTTLKSDLVAGDSYIPYPAETQKISYSNFDLGLLPAFTYTSENLDLNLGAKLYYQNHEDFNKIQILPDLQLNLALIYETLNVFAGLQGELYQHSFINLQKKNPYLVPGNMKPMLKPIELFGGIKGNFSSSFSYELRMGYRKFDNYAFFTPAYSRINFPYKLFYDTLTQSYFASGINIGIGRKLDFKLDFEYDQNNPEDLTKAVFLPDYKVKAILFFRPTEKLSVDMALLNEGSRPGNPNNLSAYTDLNLDIFYQINKQFSAFIKGNNLLNKSYEIYSGYPVEKMQIMGGVMYKFDIH
jgi:hypothetical protein